MVENAVAIYSLSLSASPGWTPLEGVWDSGWQVWDSGRCGTDHSGRCGTLGVVGLWEWFVAGSALPCPLSSRAAGIGALSKQWHADANKNKAE